MLLSPTPSEAEEFVHTHIHGTKDNMLTLSSKNITTTDYTISGFKPTPTPRERPMNYITRNRRRLKNQMANIIVHYDLVYSITRKKGQLTRGLRRMTFL